MLLLSSPATALYQTSPIELAWLREGTARYKDGEIAFARFRPLFAGMMFVDNGVEGR